VYAFSSGREIGIDVEAVRVIGDAEHIAACFFSRRENEAYLVLERRDKPLGFFNCWTRKKASSRRSATGFTIPSHCSRRALEASAASGRLLDFKGPLCTAWTPTPPLPLPYRQYIQWLRGLDYDCAKAHWQSAH